MTDFKSHLNSRKRRKASGKWQGLLAVFVTIFLLLVISLGFLRGIRHKGGFAQSIWDGSSPIAISINTSPASIMVYQKIPKKVSFLALPPDISYATGDADAPIKKVANEISSSNEGGRGFLTKYLGAKISGYILFDHEKKMNSEEARRIFKNFAFLTAPISILFNGLGEEITETNLSRLDMLRLWWQIKGINVDDVEYVDLDRFAVEIIGVGGSNFRGLDREVMRENLSPYFEDYRVVGKQIEIEILNSSGESGIGRTASEIAEITGFDVVSVTSSQSLLEKSKILTASEGKNVDYLAKLFNCDIFRLQNEEESSKITLELGRDFAKVFD